MAKSKGPVGRPKKPGGERVQLKYRVSEEVKARITKKYPDPQVWVREALVKTGIVRANEDI
jgi:transposase-like protein